MIAQFYGTALIFEAFFSTGNLVKIFAADCTDALQCIHHAIHRSRPDAAVFLQSFIVNFFTAGALLFQDNIEQNPSLSGYSASLFPELLNNQFSLHLCSVIISGFMLCLFLRHTFYLLMMIPVPSQSQCPLHCPQLPPQLPLPLFLSLIILRTASPTRPTTTTSVIKVPIETTKYNIVDKPMAVGVSAFGFSGTNAHVILEEYKTKTNKKMSTLKIAIQKEIFQASDLASIFSNKYIYFFY